MILTKDEKLKFDYIDPSGFSCFNRCPARFLFSRLIGLAPLGDRTLSMIAPDYGTCIHRAIPFAYDDPAAALEEFKRAWLPLGYEGKDEKRNIRRAEAMLLNFHKVRKFSCPYEILQFPGIKYASAETISPNEVPFLVDVGACVPLAGRIDCPARLGESKYIVALDYKTASEISARYFECFNMSPQAIAYTLALGQLTGEDVFGFAIEALRVSPSNDEVQMALIAVPDSVLVEFVDQLVATAERIKFSIDSNAFERNFAACSPYGSYGQPGRLCEYSHLCSAPHWEDALLNYQRVKPFDPFVVEGGAA